VREALDSEAQLWTPNEDAMRKLAIATTALLLLSAAPAFAMSCCGGGKGKSAMMCGKGTMTMNHGTKGKKAACCCDGNGTGGMSRRT
jgi:hypothetical protein